MRDVILSDTHFRRLVEMASQAPRLRGTRKSASKKWTATGKRTVSKKRSRSKKSRSKSKKTMKRRKVSTAEVPKRAGGKKVTASEARQLHGYINAFSQYGEGRILDGAATHSMHHPSRTRLNVDVPYDLAQPKVVHVLVIPGLSTGVFYGMADPLTAPTSVVTMNWSTPTTIKGVFSENGQYSYIENQAPAITKEPQGSFSITTEGDIARWRVVSQGLRMQYLNPESSNDGWFEACRLYENVEPSNFELTYQENVEQEMNYPWNVDLNNTYKPTKDLWQKIYLKNLAEEKSYLCGSLRDLKTYQFNCLPVSDELTFKDVYPKLSFDDEEVTLTKSTSDPTKIEGTVKFKEGSMLGVHFLNQLIDKNRDIVYIRLYPSKNGASSFLFDAAQQKEIVYTTESQLHKFMRPTQTNDAAHSASTQAMQMDLSSGQDQGEDRAALG